MTERNKYITMTEDEKRFIDSVIEYRFGDTNAIARGLAVKEIMSEYVRQSEVSEK